MARKNKYIIIKVEDAEKYLSNSELKTLHSLVRLINDGVRDNPKPQLRTKDGRPLLEGLHGTIQIPTSKPTPEAE